MARSNKSAVTATDTARFDMGAEAMDTAIKSIAIRGNKLMQDIHAVSMSILYHEAKHHNHDRLVGLMTAVHDGARRKGVVAWVEAFSNLRVTFTKGEWSVKALKPGEDGYLAVTDATLLAADAQPFWSYTKEATPIPTVIDDVWLAARLTAIVKAVNKAKADGNFKVSLAGDLAILATIETSAEKVKARVDAAVHKAGLAAIKAA